MSRHIGLIDCNNFFVSCERLFRPDLEGRPVVVLSSNDGCVVARSQEIKDSGIPMGVPYFHIKDKLEEIGAIIFSSHFALYRDISARVFNVIRDEYPEVEQYSIDESFISFESDDPLRDMLALKQRVERKVGIPVSVGIAPSKTLAKLANKVAKRGSGVFYADPLWRQDHLCEVALGEVWGVGRGRLKNFKEFNIHTVGDLLKTPERFISTNFGIEGVRLGAELRGLTVHELSPKRLLQQSFMSTRSFKSVVFDKAVIGDALLYHAECCAADLAAAGALTKQIRIMITPGRYSDFVTYGVSLEATLTEATRDIFLIQRTVSELFNKAYKSGVPYKRAGVVFGDIVPGSLLTNTLFINQDDIKRRDITEAMSLINNKLGERLIKLGRTTQLEAKWRSKQEALSPAYTTKWSDLKTVKA